MDAGADGTRAKRKQFGVFLCPPISLVVLLIWNGDFGMSPIYGHHRARRCLPLNLQVGCRKLSAMGVEKLIADLCVQRPKGRVMHLSGTKPTCHLGVSPLYPQ